jgi:hypothetical protein
VRFEKAQLGTAVGLYKIQMRQDGQWWTLGGTYDQATADERLGQFSAACSHKGGLSREFRRIAA